MPHLVVLGRVESYQFPEPQRARLVAAVTYAGGPFAPRTLYLPHERYRAATAAEIRTDSRMELVPKDAPSLQLEAQAIEADFNGRLAPA